MEKGILLYVALIMVFYDFSLHLLELIFGLKNAEKIKIYWPKFEINGKFSRKFYTSFWTLYWGIAILLIIIYLQLI